MHDDEQAHQQNERNRLQAEERAQRIIREAEAEARARLRFASQPSVPDAASRPGSASPLQIVAPLLQSPPLPQDGKSLFYSKERCGKIADIPLPGTKTSCSQAPHLPPSGQAPSENANAAVERITRSSQRKVPSAPYPNPVVSALPAREETREDASLRGHTIRPLSADIPDDILHYTPPSSAEMRAKYKLVNTEALSQRKDEAPLSIARERRTAQRSAPPPTPVQTPTSNPSVASPASGHARYKALVPSPGNWDIANGDRRPPATLDGWRDPASSPLRPLRRGRAPSHLNSPEFATHSGPVIVSPVPSVASPEFPVIRNTDGISPLLTGSPGPTRPDSMQSDLAGIGWFGLPSAAARRDEQSSPPVASATFYERVYNCVSLPQPVVVGQRAAMDQNGAGKVGGASRGAGGQREMLQGGGVGGGGRLIRGGRGGSAGGGKATYKGTPGESPHSAAARARSNIGFPGMP